MIQIAEKFTGEDIVKLGQMKSFNDGKFMSLNNSTHGNVSNIRYGDIRAKEAVKFLGIFPPVDLHQDFQEEMFFINNSLGLLNNVNKEGSN